MPIRTGRISQVRHRADEDDARIRTELERARRIAGLSIAELGRACGMSRTATSRAFDGRRPTTAREYARLGAALGLDVRLRAYPAGDPIRDAGQQRLLERFRARLHPSLRWQTEVPLQVDGDLRAWDAQIRGASWRLPMDAETVIDDVQALERRVALKQRDDGAAHVLLLVADTRRNRRALAAAPAAFGGFSRDARAALRTLGAGRDPGTSAIVMV